MERIKICSPTLHISLTKKEYGTKYIENIDDELAIYKVRIKK